MRGLKSTTNYNIFKCLFAGCNKNIPVECFLSNYNFSKGIPYLEKEGIDLMQDLIAVDVTCPFCSNVNHFRVMDRVKEISKQEFDEESNAVKSVCSKINYIYKVNIPEREQSPHSIGNTHHENASKIFRKANTSIPHEGVVSYSPPSFFDKFKGLERKEFKR